MNRFLIAAVMLPLASASLMAEDFTYEDFAGDNKFCAQLFWSNPMMGSVSRPQEGAWGKFTYDETSGLLHLSSFKNGSGVDFEIKGNQLVLDGSNTSKGVAYTEADGTSAHLTTATCGTYTLLKKTNYYFKQKQSQYSGTISRNDDGSISVVFNPTDLYLMVFTRNLWTAGNTTKELHDYFNAFSKVEFRIMDANGSILETFGDASIPVHMERVENDDDTETIYIQNFGGAGINFKNNSAADGDYEVYDKGIMMTYNKSTRTFSMDRQAYTGSLVIKDSRNIIGAGASSGYNTHAVTSKDATNLYVETQTSTFEATETTLVESGWHKDCGGHFVMETHIGATTNVDITETNSSSTTIQDYTFSMIKDVTPNASIADLQCGHSEEWGICIDGVINEDVNPDLVKSYDVFVIPGKYYEVNLDEGFSRVLEDGHTKAVQANTDGPVMSGSDSMHFRFVIPNEALVEKGWSDSDFDGNFSVYLRFNLEGEVPADYYAPKPRKVSPASALAFGGLTPISSFAVPTAVDEIENNPTTIRVENGEIVVSGLVEGTPAHTEVYTLSGASIYSGSAARIPVAPGTYIVKAPTTTAKLTVN